jgi:hypothetical protein
MDKEKIELPDHPCRYCLKRPACKICCADYYRLAFKLKEDYVHLLKEPGDPILFDYLTLYGVKPPMKNIDSLPHTTSELERWIVEWMISE